MTQFRTLYVAMLLTAAGCAASGGDGADPLDRTASPVVNGRLNHGDPSVVGLLITIPTGQSLCTGSVIAPHVVLTAAHCVEDASAIQVGFGHDLNTDASYIEAVDWAQHPDYATVFASGATDGTVQLDVGVDIAVVRLATAAPVANLPFLRAPDEPESVGLLRVVGFGVYDAFDRSRVGVKHDGRTLMRTVAPSYYVHQAATATLFGGDSGGPTFALIGTQEVIIGTHSRSHEDSRYFENRAYDTRVDQHTDFIDRHVAAWGGYESDTTAPATPMADPCQGIDAAGICCADESTHPVCAERRNWVIWCDDDNLLGQPCTSCEVDGVAQCAAPAEDGSTADTVAECSSRLNEQEISCQSSDGVDWTCSCLVEGLLLEVCTHTGNVACSVSDGCCAF